MKDEEGQSILALGQIPRDAKAKSRYELTPLCWIATIVTFVLLLLSVLILEAVSLVRSDQALNSMSAQTSKLEELRKREACRVGSQQALMTIHSYFPEDVARLKEPFKLDEEYSQSQPETWADYWEWGTRLQCNVDGSPAYANLDSDGQPSYSYNGELISTLDAPQFCKALVTEAQCDGTNPQSVIFTSWLSQIVKHRVLLIQKNEAKKRGSCVVMQSEFDQFYAVLASKYRNPCEWTAPREESS